MSIEEIINELDELRFILECNRDRERRATGVFRASSSRLVAINSAIAMLKTHPEAQPNEPLTLEELKQMYCQPVWVQYEDGIHGSWGLVELDQITLPAGAYCIIREDRFGTGWKAYRRPPKEEV